MKKTFIAMALVALTACGAKHDNPVLADSALPFGAPEFSKLYYSMACFSICLWEL